MTGKIKKINLNDTALWLPVGSIRAIITIALIIITFVIGMRLIGVALEGKPIEVIKMVKHVFQAFHSLASFMLGYYVSKKN